MSKGGCSIGIDKSACIAYPNVERAIGV